MIEIPASLPEWPGGADVAVALTFDVDAEAPWLGEGPEYASRLTMLSQARYGPARGLGRILGMLAAAGLPATFYVPGHTADQHPAAIRRRPATRTPGGQGRRAPALRAGRAASCRWPR